MNSSEKQHFYLLKMVKTQPQHRQKRWMSPAFCRIVENLCGFLAPPEEW